MRANYFGCGRRPPQVVRVHQRRICLWHDISWLTLLTLPTFYTFYTPYPLLTHQPVFSKDSQIGKIDHIIIYQVAQVIIAHLPRREPPRAGQHGKVCQSVGWASAHAA